MVGNFLIDKPFLTPNSVLSFGFLKCWAHELEFSNIQSIFSRNESVFYRHKKNVSGQPLGLWQESDAHTFRWARLFLLRVPPVAWLGEPRCLGRDCFRAGWEPTLASSKLLSQACLAVSARIPREGVSWTHCRPCSLRPLLRNSGMYFVRCLYAFRELIYVKC